MTHSRAIAAVALAGLTLTACGTPTESSSDPTPSPTPPPTASPAPVAQLAIVPPSLVDGLDTLVEEDFGPGRVTFATLPVVPGADPLTDAIQQVIDADLDRFRADTEAASEPPFPELVVTWDLVGVSPEAVGVRVRTTELFATGDDGRVAITWFDPASGDPRDSVDLVEDVDALADRVAEAAETDPRIDPALLDDELATGADAFDAMAFTTEGDLAIEFDQGHVAAPTLGPVIIAVDPDGLLSAFGQAAAEAAQDPTDPGLAPATPDPTPPATAAPDVAVPDASDVDCSQEQCVALTFDDGPVSGTSDLLDVMAEKGVRATFFVVGSNAAAQPDILARMVTEGHVVGNHTEDHPDLTKLDTDAVRAELEQVNDTVEAATGQRPVLVRPPYGATNSTVDQVTGELGMAQVLWNVDPEDWKDRDSDIVTRRVLSSTAGGNIVLSHDIHETTRDAYAAIIDGLRDQGYTLVTVPQLLGSLEPGQRYYSR